MVISLLNMAVVFASDCRERKALVLFFYCSKCMQLNDIHTYEIKTKYGFEYSLFTTPRLNERASLTNLQLVRPE